jgi:hypothetical protein
MKRFTLLLWMALIALGGSAQISRYIKVTATGTEDGTSWANAAGTANIQTIIDEVAAATNQGTVYFAAGTYLISAQIQLKNNVQLMGGYAADGSGTRDLLNNQTILDGQYNKRILFTGDNTPHLAFTKITKVDGFILQRGSSTYGSAAAISLGTVLQNCIIRNNNGGNDHGAAVFIKRHASISSPNAGWNLGGALINCVIINNTSSDRAAGVFVNQDTHFSVINCVIANNSATSTSNGVGGLLVQNNIRYSRITNNIVYNNISATAGRNDFFNPGVSASTGDNSIKFQAIWSNYFTDFNSTYLATEVLNAVPGHGNLTAANYADPLFETATTFRGHSGADEVKKAEIENSNWRLKSSSPLIGLGVASNRADIPFPYKSAYFNGGTEGVELAYSNISTDIQGNTRVLNTTVEMGAYEYDPITSTVSSSNNSHGTVNANQEVSKGSKITQTATPEAGYRFINWTENDSEVSTATSYTFTATANRTLQANFASNTVSLSAATNASATALNNCEGCDVTLNDGAVLDVDVNKTFNSVIVKPGAGISLQSGKSLTPGTLTLESTVNGTATLVDNTVSSPQSVAGTVQQYMPQGRNWYVGIPVGSGNATILTAEGLATSVSYYNEASSSWVNSYTGALTPGRGYVAVSNAGSGTNNLSFSGTLNTGSVPVTLTRLGSVKAGFNLVANPYPSYLNAMTAVNANANIEPTIWYRTKGSAYQFETVNTTTGVGTNVAGTGTVTGYIPPMQAFWLRTNLDNQAITFTNAMRTHANPNSVTTTKLKTPAASQTLLRLEVTDGTNRDETVIYFNENASDAYDKYDSPKMFNEVAIVPEIYSIAGNEKLVINGMNNYSYQTVLPLGFNTANSNQFSIRINEMQNFDSDTRIVLHDKITGRQVDLTHGDVYSFSSDAANSEDRFSVMFRSATGTTQLEDAQATGMYLHATNRQMTLQLNTGIENARVTVYTAAGQSIHSQAVYNQTTTLNREMNAGVYLVKVENAGRTTVLRTVLK